MATITGRFGAVQRVLPKKITVDGSDIWGWDGMGYTKVGGTLAVESWNVLGTPASLNRDTAARIQASGRQPAVVTAGGDYSNMVSAVQSWSLELQAQTQTYTASNLFGYNAKYVGAKSCTGTFQGIGAFPPVRPGDRFLFLGFVGPDNGQDLMLNFAGTDYVDNTKGYVYQVAAVATGVTININYSTFAPITWQVQWQSDYKNVGDELWVVGTPLAEMGFYDITPPPCGEALASQSCTLEIRADKTCGSACTKECDDPGNSIRACLESANITFNTQTQSVTNSCSAAAGGWQTSTVGATDVTLNTTIHGSSYGVFNRLSDAELENGSTPTQAAERIQARNRKFYPGDDRYVRIYLGNYYDNDNLRANCNACGAWEFNKLYVGSFTGLNVDIAGGGVVSFSTTLEFNASPKTYINSEHDCVDTSQGCEDGYIKYRLPNADRDSDPMAPENPADWDAFLDIAKYRTIGDTGFMPTGISGRSTVGNKNI
jgi:hypothetical protein